MKKYVKEYKGYKVPEGATHFGGKDDYYPGDFFYRDEGSKVFVGGQWSKTASERVDLIPLPEAQQEWMPEVGEECEVLDTCYAHPKHSEVKVKGFYNKQVWLTLPGGEDRVVLIANCKFRPLKTQQEKDREAFVKGLVKVLNSVPNGTSLSDLHTMAEKAYDAGYTAPKATDNEQK